MSGINQSTEYEIEQSSRMTVILRDGQLPGETPNALAQLFRHTLINRLVTEESWNQLVDAYAARLTDNLETRETLSGNLRKEFVRAELTPKGLMKGLLILGVTSATLELKAAGPGDQDTLARTTLALTDPLQAYTYEVEPCRQSPGSLPDESRSEVEVCTPEQADFWGVYRRPTQPDAQGRHLAQWVSDHPNQAEAQAAADQLSNS